MQDIPYISEYLYLYSDESILNKMNIIQIMNQFIPHIRAL